MMPFKTRVLGCLPPLLYVLHMVTSVRVCRYRQWKDDGAPTPFLPRRLQIAINQFERDGQQNNNSEPVVRRYGMERSRPCRRFRSLPISQFSSRPHP